MRRSIVLAFVLAISLLPANLTHAEQRGITCGLTGTAKFKKGLTLTPAVYKFTFTGTLADCQSTGGATSGTVKAKGTADASCEVGTTEGTAAIKWDNKKKTTVEFSTYDVGASVTLAATVLKSTETSVGTGDNIVGELAFEADVSQCPDGLETADFIGQIGGGSPN